LSIFQVSFREKVVEIAFDEWYNTSINPPTPLIVFICWVVQSGGHCGGVHTSFFAW